jgi:hypothetical protein
MARAHTPWLASGSWARRNRVRNNLYVPITQFLYGLMGGPLSVAIVLKQLGEDE